MSETTDHTDNTDEAMIHEELSGKIIGAGMGNAYRVRDNLTNTVRLISMAESYPCHPCNPWFPLMTEYTASTKDSSP
jgi:hypothetical protein